MGGGSSSFVAKFDKKRVPASAMVVISSPSSLDVPGTVQTGGLSPSDPPGYGPDLVSTGLLGADTDRDGECFLESRRFGFCSVALSLGADVFEFAVVDIDEDVDAALGGAGRLGRGGGLELVREGVDAEARRVIIIGGTFRGEDERIAPDL